jgi:hypothetical protein
MSTDAPPKGALEEAVSLFDELIPLADDLCCEHEGTERGKLYIAIVTDLQRRRAALEPRLAKRRENQAKPRGDKS